MARRNENPKSADRQNLWGDRQAFPAARLRKLNSTKQQLAWPKDISCHMKKSLRSRACAWVFRMLRDERCDRKPSIAVRTVV